MEYEIKRINILSVIKFLFILSFVCGAFVGLFYVFMLKIFSSLIFTYSGELVESDGVLYNGISIFLKIISFAVFSSLFICFMSTILILIYNLISSWFGGIRFNLVPIDEQQNLHASQD